MSETSVGARGDAAAERTTPYLRSVHTEIISALGQGTESRAAGAENANMSDMKNKGLLVNAKPHRES